MDCDQVDFTQVACDAIQNNECTHGMGFCRTGQAINISANKFKGIRAALIFDEYTAQKSICHNGANFFSFASKYISDDILHGMLVLLMHSTFDGGILSPLNIERVYPLDQLYYVDALNWNGKGVVCDWLNFSDSRIMNEIGRIYTLLDDYIDLGLGLCGENMMSEHMRRMHIIFEAVPFSFFLIRDRAFEDKSHHGQWH